MKKLWSIVLGFLVCLALTACGGAKAETLASDIIVHLEVNPSFDIHVNNDGTIKSVDCLNEDAQTVYAAMDLSGTAYEEGFKQLLTAIHEKGFLSEGAEIKVEIKQKSSVTYEVSKVTDTVIADFDTNVAAVEAVVSSEVVEEQKTGGISEVLSSVTSQINPKWELWVVVDTYEENQIFCARLYLDEDKKITSVKDVVGASGVDVTGMSLKEGVFKLFDSMNTPMQDGAQVEYKILKEQTPFDLADEMYEIIEQYHGKKGVLIGYRISNQANPYAVFDGKLVGVRKDGDGNFYKFIDNIEQGEEVLLEVYNADGSYVEQHYENGKLVLLESFAPDGTYAEQHYDESSTLYPVFIKRVSPDGSVTEETNKYDANEQLTYRYRVMTGSYNEITEQFYENGKIKKSITKQDDGTAVTIYDENEQPAEMTHEYTDGKKTVTTFKDGNITGSVTYEADGTVWKFDGAGNEIK